MRQFGTDRLQRLVIVDMEATRFQWDDYEYGLSDLEGIIDVLTLVQEDPIRFIERFTEQVFWNPTDRQRTLCFDEATRTPAPIQSAILFGALTVDNRSVLPEIDVPILVSAGAKETRGPGTVASVRYVADLVPNASFELFEGSGHCPPLEEPDRFNQVVREFIDVK